MSADTTENTFAEIQQSVRAELEQNTRELKEIELMIEQSQLEVEKLMRRNNTVTSKLQQIQAQFDSMPRSDIRAAYDAALDAQQRLFVMRGQLEKLQSDKKHLERYREMLEKFWQVLETMPVSPGGGARPTRSLTATAEKLETMIQAQEAERQRLSQQMHDGPAQALSNFILQTEIAMRLFDMDQEKARAELVSLKSAATSTFQKVRSFIAELRPMMLDDLGLVPTLKQYVENFKEQADMDVRLNVTGGEQRLSPYLEVMIFRAVQELLGNVARHSQATLVKILLDISEKRVRISVEDNGRGFNPQDLLEHKGMGLKLIKDRVDMLGGQMDVDSAPGQGTRIMFEVPASWSNNL
ncbi:MAG: sensor histidine kinase [Anaerolineae bacterium]|nr:MAG: sensor histidine kinase [Anaerolineae bacterium]